MSLPGGAPPRLRTPAALGKAFYSRWSPKGDRIAFFIGHNMLFVDPASEDTSRLRLSERWILDAAWDPSGTRRAARLRGSIFLG